MSYIGINYNRNINPFLQTLPEDSYTDIVKRNIHLLSFDKNGEPPAVFGSYIYRIQKYPGDIDLRESYIGCCSIGDVVTRFAKSLKRVVNAVLKERNHYMSEFKAGIDTRYYFDLGDCVYGIYTPDRQLAENVENLYRNELLTLEEVNIIFYLLRKPQLNGDDYDVIKTVLRDHYVLRWSAEEILKGYKKVRGGLKIKLTDALRMKAHVKIDVISLIDGKFVEITNFLMLAYEDEGELIPINLDVNIDDPRANQFYSLIQLPLEVEKLYYSNMFYSPFKMVKRFYAMARSKGDQEMLKKVIPFVSSNTSLAYQIKSEIDTIALLYERVSVPAKKAINDQVDGMKTRIARILEIPSEQLEPINELIDLFVSPSKKDRYEKIKYLKMIKEILVRFINYESITYLNKVGLNPPPDNYLPPLIKDRPYKRIVRLPTDIPKNPLKKVAEYVHEQLKEEKSFYPIKYAKLPKTKLGKYLKIRPEELAFLEGKPMGKKSILLKKGHTKSGKKVSFGTKKTRFIPLDPERREKILDDLLLEFEPFIIKTFKDELLIGKPPDMSEKRYLRDVVSGNTELFRAIYEDTPGLKNIIDKEIDQYLTKSEEYPTQQENYFKSYTRRGIDMANYFIDHAEELGKKFFSPPEGYDLREFYFKVYEQNPAFKRYIDSKVPGDTNPFIGFGAGLSTPFESPSFNFPIMPSPGQRPNLIRFPIGSPGIKPYPRLLNLVAAAGCATCGMQDIVEV
jgi:hypothetical protein